MNLSIYILVSLILIFAIFYIMKQIRLAREKIKLDKDNKISLTPEAQLLSDQFSSNKGKLP